jgi:hypothetical protein
VGFLSLFISIQGGKTMAELIIAQGATTTVFPQDTSFTLKEIYSLLNCNQVQIISLNDGRIMWLDEEGKFKPHFFNSTATRLLHESGGMDDDYIAGAVLITSQDEVQ